MGAPGASARRGSLTAAQELFPAAGTAPPTPTPGPRVVPAGSWSAPQLPGEGVRKPGTERLLASRQASLLGMEIRRQVSNHGLHSKAQQSSRPRHESPAACGKGRGKGGGWRDASTPPPLTLPGDNESRGSDGGARLPERGRSGRAADGTPAVAVSGESKHDAVALAASSRNDAGGGARNDAGGGAGAEGSPRAEKSSHAQRSVSRAAASMSAALNATLQPQWPLESSDNEGQGGGWLAALFGGLLTPPDARGRSAIGAKCSRVGCNCTLAREVLAEASEEDSDDSDAPQRSMWERLRRMLTALTRTSLVSSDHLRRHLHDEVTYRENTFPKAKRYASRDWMHIMWTWPKSTVLHRIRSPIIVTTAWTVVLALAVQFQQVFGILGSSAAQFTTGFSKTPHTITGSAMSLLLVFRTNAAYTRFWEGRCIWEQVTNKARDITRVLIAYRAVIGDHACHRLADLLCAFPVALKQHLEGFKGLEQERELSQLLDPQDLSGVMQAVNRPLFILNRMALIVTAVPYDAVQWTSRERLSVLTMVNELGKCVGSCERIVQTPIPLHYARHTGRFMGLFCLTLPFLFIGEMGMLAVPVVACVVWCLFGVQEIGLLIENPFSQTREGTWALPLAIMADSIRFDVWEALDSVGLGQVPSRAPAPQPAPARPATVPARPAPCAATATRRSRPQPRARLKAPCRGR